MSKLFFKNDIFLEYIFFKNQSSKNNKILKSLLKKIKIKKFIKHYGRKYSKQF